MIHFVSIFAATRYSRSSRGRVVRRSDTNVLAVKFNKLIEPSDVHTGDPVVCTNKNCSAILSHLSSMSSQDGKDESVSRGIGSKVKDFADLAY